MTKLEQSAWQRAHRSMVAPYWCQGSPLEWHSGEVGIAHLAMNGRVGTFNLSWWLLDRLTPPLSQAYREINHSWVHFYAPSVKINGRTLEEHAALSTLGQWNQLVSAKNGYMVGMSMTREELLEHVKRSER